MLSLHHPFRKRKQARGCADANELPCLPLQNGYVIIAVAFWEGARVVEWGGLENR